LFRPLALVLPLAAALPAQAAPTQIDWNGHYRARGLAFHSLSLSNDHDQSEGTSQWADHQLRLQPRFILSDRVSLRTQIDALSGVPWGDDAEGWTDPTTGESVPLALDQTVVAPTTDDGAATPAGVTITRAWGEVYTEIGRLSFGRMPLEWGSGILLNAGLEIDSEYGDTADRVQFTTRAGPFYVKTAYDWSYEGYLNDADDMHNLTAALLYRTESVGAGFHNQLRFQPSEDFTAYIGDIWLYAELGPATLEAEIVGVFGGGNLDEDTNDVSFSAFGAMASLDIQTQSLSFGLEAGFASGDADPDDDTIKTFSFDRDHNVGLLLFEEPLPTLAAKVQNETTQGREYDAVRTGEGVKNALYLRPSVGMLVLDNLWGELSLLAAQAAKLPDDEAEEGKGYGIELGAALDYTPFEHFAVRGQAGVLFPGKIFSAYEHDEFGGGYEDPAYAGRLTATVAF
jgi:hypothetical protein